MFSWEFVKHLEIDGPAVVSVRTNNNNNNNNNIIIIIIIIVIVIVIVVVVLNLIEFYFPSTFS